MPTYSPASIEQRDSLAPDLIVLFEEVLKKFDHTIIYGYRDPKLQFELFQKGRKLVDGEWIITDKKKVVTYKDGTINKSKHNLKPSEAADVVPYPMEKNDSKKIYVFAGWVLGAAQVLFNEGKMTHKIRWGGDWDGDHDLKDQTFMDLCHFEIVTNN